jgi:hypothetical protein
MTEIKLESGIPFPTWPRFGAKGITGVLRSMKVGDSFVTALENRTSATSAAPRLNIKVTTRKISETEVRVWRIA